ncbi:MAG TPA: DUF4157 domain-containing protein, partial [Sediminibacterium sp.]|nr:DUF4157 domain-containing protein [Sediminibacterium sp.]
MSYKIRHPEKSLPARAKDRGDESNRKGIHYPAVSPVQQKMEEKGGDAPIQKLGEEEPVQGKFQPIQKIGQEEEPVQGKFDTLQKVEEEEPLQGKFQTVQQMGPEEEPVQGKFAVMQQQADEEDPMQLRTAGQISANTLQKKEEENGPGGLPAQLRNGIEQLSGQSMRDVKVHYNSSRPAQLKALAFAQGSEIHIGPGQEKHLPHEAWHVAQQKQGRVQPTVQMKEGVPVNDDPSLEKEADLMGAKALQGKFTAAGLSSLSTKFLTNGT